MMKAWRLPISLLLVLGLLACLGLHCAAPAAAGDRAAAAGHNHAHDPGDGTGPRCDAPLPAAVKLPALDSQPAALAWAQAPLKSYRAGMSLVSPAGRVGPPPIDAGAAPPIADLVVRTRRLLI